MFCFHFSTPGSKTLAPVYLISLSLLSFSSSSSPCYSSSHFLPPSPFSLLPPLPFLSLSWLTPSFSAPSHFASALQTLVFRIISLHTRIYVFGFTWIHIFPSILIHCCLKVASHMAWDLVGIVLSQSACLRLSRVDYEADWHHHIQHHYRLSLLAKNLVYFCLFVLQYDRVQCKLSVRIITTFIFLVHSFFIRK